MAAQDSGLPDAIAPWANFGVLGLVLVAIFFGWIWARPAVDALRSGKDEAIANLIAERDRLIGERDDAEAQRDAAIAIAQEKLVPLLTTFTATIQTFTPLLQDVVHLVPLLQQLVRESDDRSRRLPGPGA